MDRIPFHVPTVDETDVPGVVEVLRSHWVTTGPKARAFEEAYAAYLLEGAPEELHALAVNSGTAALHLALEACGVREGDRVIVPTWTFTASGEVVRYLGADPVFCDVDPVTLNMSPDNVEEAIGRLDVDERDRVKAIVPVHFAGLACDMGALEALACSEGHGWDVVDDAAHSLPSTHGGRQVGRWGRATAFSFYATKTLCTGEGGMVVTRDAELAARMRVMRLHGISRDAFDRYRSDKPAWEYEIVAPGFKYNMGDIAAALGLSQLERVDAFRAARRAIAARYTEAFELVEGLHPPADAPAGDAHSWHIYALRVDGGRAVRNRLIEELSEAGVGTSVHFIPLHRQPYWRERYGLDDGDFPVASEAFEKEVSLPIFPSMTDAQIDRVCEELPRAFERARVAAMTKSSDG